MRMPASAKKARKQLFFKYFVEFFANGLQPAE